MALEIEIERKKNEENALTDVDHASSLRGPSKDDNNNNSNNDNNAVREKRGEGWGQEMSKGKGRSKALRGE